MSDDEERNDETDVSKESSSTKSESKEERKSGRDKERTDRGMLLVVYCSKRLIPLIWNLDGHSGLQDPLLNRHPYMLIC